MGLFNRLIFIVLSIFFIACGGGNNDTQKTITSVNNVPEFAVIEDDDISTSATSVSGSGTIVFADPLSDDAAGFKIQFDLVNEASAISFFIYSDSKLSESGAVLIKIQKKDGQLTGTLKISGSDAVDIDLEPIPETEDTLYIDVHNDEEPTHILFWLKNTAIFNDTSSVFNSEDSDEISTLGQKKGTGFFVGVKLENASLKSFDIGSPRFED